MLLADPTFCCYIGITGRLLYLEWLRRLIERGNIPEGLIEQMEREVAETPKQGEGDKPQLLVLFACAVLVSAGLWVQQIRF